MGEAAFRRVRCGAKGDSPRDSGQKRRKHVGSPRFAESAFFRLNDRGFAVDAGAFDGVVVGILALLFGNDGGHIG